MVGERRRGEAQKGSYKCRDGTHERVDEGDSWRSVRPPGADAYVGKHWYPGGGCVKINSRGEQGTTQIPTTLPDLPVG